MNTHQSPFSSVKRAQVALSRNIYRQEIEVGIEKEEYFASFFSRLKKITNYEKSFYHSSLRSKISFLRDCIKRRLLLPR